jgi:hypothetical protein
MVTLEQMVSVLYFLLLHLPQAAVVVLLITITLQLVVQAVVAVAQLQARLALLVLQIKVMQVVTTQQPQLHIQQAAVVEQVQ